jgi:hypothetical protein
MRTALQTVGDAGCEGLAAGDGVSADDGISGLYTVGLR